MFRRERGTSLRAAATRMVRQAARGRRRRAPLEPVLLWPGLSSLRFVFWAVAALAALAAGLTLSGVAPPLIGREILGTVWQVQGALLGLAVAVSIFAYQSLGSGQGSRRRLILLTGHPAAIVTGVALAFLTGAAFLGSTVPFGGWLGVFATCLTATWLALLLVTLAQAPHLQDQRYAIGMRLRALARSVHSSIHSQQLERASSRILAERLAAAHGEFAVWPGSVPPPQLIVAGRSGIVRDASVSGLERAARLVAEAGGTLRIAVRLGQRVEAELPIASCDIAIPAAAARAVQESLVVGSGSGPTLQDDLLDLHDDAIRSLESAPDIVDEVLSAYYSVLEEYAREWSVFVDLLETENLPAWGEAELGPTSQIRESLLKLFQRSVEGRHRDSAFAVAYFPIGLLQRAIRWHAPGYFDFVGLYPSYYWLASQDAVPPDMKRIFRERAWWHPVEALELVLPALAHQGSDLESELVSRATARVDVVVLEVLRACIREGDLENFTEGLRRWRLASG